MSFEYQNVIGLSDIIKMLEAEIYTLSQTLEETQQECTRLEGENSQLKIEINKRRRTKKRTVTQTDEGLLVSVQGV